VSSTQHVLAAAPRAANRQRRPRFLAHLHGAELHWALVFVLPYAAVLVAFAVYPVLYGFWMARDPAIYLELFADDEYWDAVVTTLFYVGIGVNFTMLLALLLSGYFARRRWWIKALLVLSMLPWALPGQVAFISFHWMLIYPGFIDALSWKVLGVDGPDWFHYYWSALGSNIAAAIDGATGFRRFRHLVFPLLANLYLVCTLLCTVWMLGDFNTPEIVSGGAPQGQTTVLATLGVDYLMEKGKPALGVGVAVSALPLLVPIAWLLVRRMRRSEVQL
jgi:multiple sugar transport system permease protein